MLCKNEILLYNKVRTLAKDFFLLKFETKIIRSSLTNIGILKILIIGMQTL